MTINLYGHNFEASVISMDWKAAANPKDRTQARSAFTHLPERIWQFRPTTRPGMTRIKQVILIRKDLGMRRGKEIAQGSHASMDFMIEPLRHLLQQNQKPLLDLTDAEKHWIIYGMAKVCLKVNSEEELIAHHEKALAAGLKSYMIQDSGRTEFHGEPTLTACAIGPAEADAIDAITGDLVLY